MAFGPIRPSMGHNGATGKPLEMNSRVRMLFLGILAAVVLLVAVLMVLS